MKFFARLVPVVFGTVSLVQAETLSTRNKDPSGDSFLSEFIAALGRNNLTTLAENYQRIAQTDDGKPVIDFLKNNGELTLLAPDNRAFNSNCSTIEPDVLLYNTLWGSIDKGFKTTDSDYTRRRRDAPSESHSTAPSGFQRRDSDGNTKRSQSLDKFQVQVIDQRFTSRTSSNWKRWSNDPLILIDRAIGSAKVVGRFNFKQIIVLTIDTVLTLPVTVSKLLCKPLIKLAPNGLARFNAALQKACLQELVDKRDAITMFAPIDDEFCDIDKLSKDELASFVKNHFFFGKIVFSPLFSSVRNATAASGKELKFSSENNVNYVSCGKTKAIVLRRDVIPANGVLHVIDKPLKCD